MKKHTILLLALTVLFTLQAQTTQKPLKIILKLDDYPAHRTKCAISKEVLDYLCEKDIKAGIGIIAANLNDSSTSVLRPYLKKKAGDKTALFEFWHHGLFHENFPLLTAQEQKLRFERADSIVRKRLGIQMHAFGAPGNSSDSVTSAIITENPNYKVLMFMKSRGPNMNKVLYLNNRVNMENGTGKPEFDFFVENFNKAVAKNMSVMVLQGHPNMYTTPEKMDQFRKIIQFLIDQKVCFTTPYEYYNELSSKK